MKVLNLTFYVSMTNVNITQPPSQRCCPNPGYIFHVPCAFCMSLLPILFDSKPPQYHKETNYDALHYAFSPVLCQFTSPRSYNLLNNLFSNTLNLPSSLKVTDWVSHLHKKVKLKLHVWSSQQHISTDTGTSRCKWQDLGYKAMSRSRDCNFITSR
jgi:hypothetical protein